MVAPQAAAGTLHRGCVQILLDRHRRAEVLASAASSSSSTSLRLSATTARRHTQHARTTGTTIPGLFARTGGTTPEYIAQADDDILLPAQLAIARTDVGMVLRSWRTPPAVGSGFSGCVRRTVSAPHLACMLQAYLKLLCEIHGHTEGKGSMAE